MGYLVDIAQKMCEMKDKELHEEFTKITDFITSQGRSDLYPVMYRIITHYDFVARQNIGLKQTNDNLHEKLYGRSNQYTGGHYTKGEKGQI